MKKLSRKRLERILGGFGRIRTLVVGDLMLDRFVWGIVTRISPEAPVPVVEVTSESDMPGGSANVISNICALGGRVHVGGIIGDDRIGTTLRRKLTNRRIDLNGVIVAKNRTTTLKTRIIAHSQQMVRIDNEDKSAIKKAEISRVLSYVKTIISRIDAIILEDYGKGMLAQSLVSSLVSLALKNGKIITVDPKMGHVLDYRGITAITPNRPEAYWLAGLQPDDASPVERVGNKIIDGLSCGGVLITLGENGMCLFEKGRKATAIPTAAREVYDVSGAGDTVISVFTSSLAAGATMPEAAAIANYAAGVVVGKVGTGIVKRSEILEAWQS